MTTNSNRLFMAPSCERPARGITLIEMIIVMAVLGIVASLVYPSYVDRSRKARRVDATSTLMNIAGEQERFFLRNNRYANSASELGITSTENGLYDIDITVGGGGTEFVATATPAAGESQVYDVDCSTISIDQLGRKLSTANAVGGDDTTNCWR